MKKLFFYILFLLGTEIFPQQNFFPDFVDSVSFGIGNFSNQSQPYFPNNVLGETSTIATEFIPEVSPDEICSLGLNGEIILGFSQNPIIDLPGKDFTIFENVFKIQFGIRAGEYFAEPAKVAASYDGITFYEFPFDSLTLEGLAGKTPTFGNQNPTNPFVSGGDSFDLAEIGLDSARFIKITDVCEIIKSDTSHPFYDFTINGFDLDGIAIVSPEFVNIQNTSNQVEQFELGDIYPNPVKKGNSINVEILSKNNFSCHIRIFNILGEIISDEKIQIHQNFNEVNFKPNFLSTGIYFVQFLANHQTITKKFLVIN